MSEKECHKCLKTLPLTEYYRINKHEENVRPWCKTCSRKSVNACKARQRSGLKVEKKKNNRRAERAAYRLKSDYGMSEDGYQSMLDSQFGKCANLNCANIATNHVKRKLFVDHNHTTGQVRGLLCQHCNFALGLVDDRIETLLGLVDYLNMNDGTSHGGLVAHLYIRDEGNA